jgi:Tol biopolymer transport system component
MLWTKLTGLLALILVTLCTALIVTIETTGRDLPIGDQIAYISRLNSRTWDIYLMDVDRGLAYNLSRRFTATPLRHWLPTWSPDGHELAFVSEFSQGADIFVMDTRTSAVRMLNSRTRDETAPAWSPPGVGLRRIAYAAFVGGNWDIYVSRVGGDSGITLIRDSQARAFVGGPSNDYSPAWSPDGSALLFVSDRSSSRDLYLIDAGGRDLRRLTNGMEIEERPEWSPDGSRIAFVTGHDNDREIYLLEVSSGQITNLTRSLGDDYDPAWSPDGSRIAFTSARNGYEDIYVINADGSGLLRLTQNGTHNHGPVWSPDGSRLVYVSFPGQFSEIYVIAADGGAARRLTRNRADDWSPVWRP